MAIAQRFNAGITSSTRQSPVGTKGATASPFTSTKRSAILSSLAGLDSFCLPGPSVKTLGYCQTETRPPVAAILCRAGASPAVKETPEPGKRSACPTNSPRSREAIRGRDTRSLYKPGEAAHRLRVFPFRACRVGNSTGSNDGQSGTGRDRAHNLSRFFPQRPAAQPARLIERRWESRRGPAWCWSR